MVDRMKLRCFGYLIRMDSNRNAGKVWETRVEGSRGRGMPRIEWEGHVRKLAGRKGKSLQEEIRLASERKAFRNWLTQPDA
jgi:ribosomal protein L21E